MNSSKIIECPENKQEITPQNRLFIQMRIPKKVSESLLFSYHDNVFESTTKCYIKINQISRINDDHLCRVRVFFIRSLLVNKMNFNFSCLLHFSFHFRVYFHSYPFFFLISYLLINVESFFSLRVYSN